MFPNVRLMIVAVLASIMGISCALALFAEFRVSHDSFLRASNATAPLQLGSHDAAPALVVNTAAPFEFRFQANLPPPAVVEAAPRSLAPEHEAGIEAPPGLPAAESLPEPASSPATATDAAETAATIGSSPEPAVPPAPPVSVPANVPVVASAPEPAAPPASPENAPGPQQLTATGSVAGAAADLATRTPTAARPVKATKAEPESKVPPQSAKSPAPSRNARAMLRRRPVVARRYRRSRPSTSTQSIGQNFGAGQPAYQWTLQSGLQSPQPVRRRVVIRRVRPSRRPAATAAPQTTAAGN